MAMDWKAIHQEYAENHLDVFLYAEVSKGESSLEETIPESIRPAFANSWRHNWIRNHHLRKSIKEVETTFQQHGIDAVLLKGMALLGTLYSDFGQRFMSDIDLLLSPLEMDLAQALLIELGYREIEEIKWEANSFKRIYQKQDALAPITIELHSRLFFQHDTGEWDRTNHPDFTHFQKLDTTEQFVHLLGHFGYQHTCLSFLWFVELDRYLRKYVREIDWPAFYQRVQQLRQWRAARLILFALHRQMQTPVPQFARQLSFPLRILARFIFTRTFLWEPGKRPFRYYLLKHLFKDSIRDAFEYDLKWLRARMRF